MIQPKLSSEIDAMVRDKTITRATAVRFRKTYAIMERLRDPIQEDEPGLMAEQVNYRAMIAAMTLVK